MRSLPWKFYNPTEIHFGGGFPDELSLYAPELPLLYVTSTGHTKRGITQQVEDFLVRQDISYKKIEVALSNPSFRDIQNIVSQIQASQPEYIFALGGGSIIDLAKILSYVLGRGAPSLPRIFSSLIDGKALPEVDCIPVIAIPTTAGTGSEVTPFATLWDMENKKKYSLGTQTLFPKKAFLFPELTTSLPWPVTLSTGLDALSQCLESVWNIHYSDISGTLAAYGAQSVFTYLPILKKNPEDMQARGEMLKASLFSGLCIASTKTAMAHAISYPLTAHYGTSHGIACSFTLPALWDYNFEADDGRMKIFAESLGQNPKNFSNYILDFLHALNFGKEFKKSISSFDKILTFSPEMYAPGRSNNNLRPLTLEYLEKLLETASAPWIKTC